MSCLLPDTVSGIFPEYIPSPENICLSALCNRSSEAATDGPEDAEIPLPFFFPKAVLSPPGKYPDRCPWQDTVFPVLLCRSGLQYSISLLKWFRSVRCDPLPSSFYIQENFKSGGQTLYKYPQPNPAYWFFSKMENCRKNPGKKIRFLSAYYSTDCSE